MSASRESESREGVRVEKRERIEKEREEKECE